METRTPTLDAPGKRNKRRGATALEYIFALSLIFVVCIATITYLGDKVKSSLNDSASKVPDVPGQKK